MKISEIDKNMTVYSTLPEDVEWFDINEEPFTLYGVKYDGFGFCRLPAELAKSVSEQIYSLSRATAGGRVRFKTDSPYVAVKVHYSETHHSPHMTYLNAAGFDIYENTATGSCYLRSFLPPWDMNSNFANYVQVGGGQLRDYTLNLPPYGAPDAIAIGLKKGSLLEKTDGYCDRAPILFYGSSITQGGCASRPGVIYQNYISRRFNIDYINLGFSGNGQAQEPVVEYMAGLDFSVFVSDYDHNAPSLEHLKNTHYKMYERIRESHPDVPYIMISKPDIDEWGGVDRRAVIMESYHRARANGDRNVYYIDGKRLFDGEDRDNCTVDGCHPNDLGMYRFASVLIGELKKILR